MMTTSTVVLSSATAPIDSAYMRRSLFDHGMASRFTEEGADIEPQMESMSIAAAEAEDGSGVEMVPRDATLTWASSTTWTCSWGCK